MKEGLNKNVLKFVLELEKEVAHGKIISKKEIEKGFLESTYFKKKIENYQKDSLGKAVWWGLKRSGKWEKIKNGLYKKVNKVSCERKEFIEYLSIHLFEVLMMKNDIKEETLKKISFEL